MSVERELFIDIDRQPEREGIRPADAPVKKSVSRLWPPPTDDLVSTGRPDASAAPSSGRVGNLAVLPTMPLDPDLVESLAALAPTSTASRPLSLAEALAAMQASTLTLMPTRPLEPAPQETPAAEPPPAPPGLPAGRRATDGLFRIRVPDAEPLPPPEQLCPQETPDDGYLACTYDVTRPAVAELYERTVVPLWSAPFGRMLLSVFQGHACQPGWQVLDVGCGTGYPTLD
ncbi:MAG TPA: hypothetical protein VFU69_00960, partial [Ktedonobacterales bacterium]|nr:hypothetical protein [Ktedonobacterales bacterium]